MHSSRMCTAHSLPYGGSLSGGGGEVSVHGGLCPEGSLTRGVSVQGISVQEESLSGRPPSPVNRMTDRCKNITLPQTLFAGGRYFQCPWTLDGLSVG